MPDRFAHCTFCGARFTPGQPWPRRCAACGEISYRNPAPVAVAVQPVGSGLLVVRRGIPPAIGQPALPGGFIEVGETWQQALVRELSEETAISQDAADVRHFATLSAPDVVLIFGVLPPFADPLPDVSDISETQELLVLDKPAELAFPLHTEVAGRFFAP